MFLIESSLSIKKAAVPPTPDTSTKKNAAKEDELETALLDNDFIYEKSEDVYIDDDDIFVIYYTVWQKTSVR